VEKDIVSTNAVLIREEIEFKNLRELLQAKQTEHDRLIQIGTTQSSTCIILQREAQELGERVNRLV
jgi:hypothetical protein